MDRPCTGREHCPDDTMLFLQAALAAEDAATDLARDPDEDAWSQASSAVSGMSAYTSATSDPAGASAAASSSGQPASTVGGRRPAKKKKGKVGQVSRQLVHCDCSRQQQQAAHQERRRARWVLAWLVSLSIATRLHLIPRASFVGLTELAQSHNQGPQDAHCLQTSHKLGLQKVPCM